MYIYDRRVAGVSPKDYNFEPLAKKAEEAFRNLQEARRLITEIREEIDTQLHAAKTPENPNASPAAYRNTFLMVRAFEQELAGVIKNGSWPELLVRSFRKYL